MVAHEDGQICKWAEFASMQLVGRPKKKNKGETPTYVICPRCGERGRLNWAYDINARKGERPFSFRYVVVHESIPGTWGKEKMKKRRRCQSFTTEERISILKQIGRYIADPPKPKTLQMSIKQKNSTEHLNPLLENPENAKMGYRDSEAPRERNQVEQLERKDHTFIPRGKRLTICSSCGKQGYKYKTYFQHSNESPIGPRLLKGKQDGWRYRRCSLHRRKAEQGNTIRQAAPKPGLIKEEKSYLDTVRKLDRYIQQSGSNQLREGDDGKDYKKMYWDLVNNLKKIVGTADGK